MKLQKLIQIAGIILLAIQIGSSQPVCSMPAIKSWLHLTETMGFGVDTLWFGFDSTATYGIDSQLCEFEILPTDCPLLFRDVYNRTDLGNGVLNDFRGIVNASQVDTHNIAFGVSWPTEYTFHWSPSGIREICDSAVLTSPFGGYRQRLDLIDSTAQFSDSTPLYLIVYGVNTVVTDVLVESEDRGSFHLDQNYPNPFNPKTSIRYQLSEQGFVVLEIVNLSGQVVRTLVNGIQGPGLKIVEFVADGMPSGVFYARLNAGAAVSYRKMLLVR